MIDRIEKRAEALETLVAARIHRAEAALVRLSARLDRWADNVEKGTGNG
ncbi:hypothetical protein [Tropicibacter alexandrii]|nr:hypothetical protein [Tropicibacter alexandrii]